jgi:hypothetical protein
MIQESGMILEIKLKKVFVLLYVFKRLRCLLLTLVM